MQILASAIVLSMKTLQFHEDESAISIDTHMPNYDYVVLYLVLHIISYLVHFFRIHDIKVNGKPDMNGVYSARRESFVSNCETFLICIVIGFTVKHLFVMGDEVFH